MRRLSINDVQRVLGPHAISKHKYASQHAKLPKQKRRTYSVEFRLSNVPEQEEEIDLGYYHNRLNIQNVRKRRLF